MIAQSIANCMSGIQASDITELTVTGASRRLVSSSLVEFSVSLRAALSEEHRQLQTSNSVHTSYVVVSHTAGTTYESLSSQLTTAVNNGNFNSYLSTNAQQQGATALETVTSAPVTTEPVSTSSGSSSDSLSGGAIAGIVIAVLVVVGVIVGVAYYYIVYGFDFPLEAFFAPSTPAQNEVGGGGSVAGGRSNNVSIDSRSTVGSRAPSTSAGVPSFTEHVSYDVDVEKRRRLQQQQQSTGVPVPGERTVMYDNPIAARRTREDSKSSSRPTEIEMK